MARATVVRAGLSMVAAAGILAIVWMPLPGPVFGLEYDMKIIALGAGVIGYFVGAWLGARQLHRRVMPDFRRRAAVIGVAGSIFLFFGLWYSNIWDAGGIAEWYATKIRIVFGIAVFSLFFLFGFVGFHLPSENEKPTQ